jgi:hypothetical protein
MREEILKIFEDAKKEISKVKTQQELLNTKAQYLGKEGKLTSIMKLIKDLSIEEKKTIGVLINNIKNELEDLIKIKLDDIYKLTSKSTVFDNTLPIDNNLGTLSPITIVAKEVTDILVKMGFVVVSGPEKEFDYYNFEALNIPKTHPARDMQDTYWLDNGQLLRTHTLMRNLGGSMGIATVTTMYERFTQKFVNRLGENVTPFDPGATAMLESLRSLWTGAGSGPALADRQAIAGMYGLVQRQAAMLAFVEAFVLLAVVFLLMIPLILITKRPPRGARAQMGH